MNLYWSAYEPLLVARVTYIGRSSDLYRLTHPAHGEVGSRAVRGELQRGLFPPAPWVGEPCAAVYLYCFLSKFVQMMSWTSLRKVHR